MSEMRRSCLTAALTELRRGELIAPPRCHVDLSEQPDAHITQWSSDGAMRSGIDPLCERVVGRMAAPELPAVGAIRPGSAVRA
jgi:hypothetical protein